MSTKIKTDGECGLKTNRTTGLVGWGVGLEKRLATEAIKRNVFYLLGIPQLNAKCHWDYSATSTHFPLTSR